MHHEITFSLYIYNTAECRRVVCDRVSQKIRPQLKQFPPAAAARQKPNGYTAMAERFISWSSATYTMGLVFILSNLRRVSPCGRFTTDDYKVHFRTFNPTNVFYLEIISHPFILFFSKEQNSQNCVMMESAAQQSIILFSLLRCHLLHFRAGVAESSLLVRHSAAPHSHHH